MKSWLKKTFTPWKSASEFDSEDAFFAHLVRMNKALNAIRVILFAAAAVLLLLGYGADEPGAGYSIAAIRTQPYYLIAVLTLLAALGVSLLIIQNEKPLPPELRMK